MGVSSASCLTGSGKRGHRTVKWLCALTPTSCVTTGTGSTRTAATEPDTAIRSQYRLDGTDCRHQALTPMCTCRTAPWMQHIFLKETIEIDERNVSMTNLIEDETSLVLQEHNTGGTTENDQAFSKDTDGQHYPRLISKGFPGVPSPIDTAYYDRRDSHINF